MKMKITRFPRVNLCKREGKGYPSWWTEALGEQRCKQRFTGPKRKKNKLEMVLLTKCKEHCQCLIFSPKYDNPNRDWKPLQFCLNTCFGNKAPKCYEWNIVIIFPPIPSLQPGAKITCCLWNNPWRKKSKGKAQLSPAPGFLLSEPDAHSRLNTAHAAGSFAIHNR